MDSDKRILFDFEISGKWLYPSYAFTYAAIAAKKPNKIPITKVNNAVLFCRIVFMKITVYDDVLLSSICIALTPYFPR